MTFRLADPEALYPFDVTVQVPSVAGGFDSRIVRILFRLMSTEEEDALVGQGDLEYLRGVIGGWGEEAICEHDGTPLEFSDASIEKLALIPYFVVSIQLEYRRFILALPGKPR